MASFIPPAASATQCKRVPFNKAIDIAADNKAAFDAFDTTLAGRRDPSKCKALLAFPAAAAIFGSSKLAIDADGPAAGPGRPSGSRLDPGSGQDDTSLHFSNAIRVHKALHPPAPDPCIRDGSGFCRRIHNVSIEEDVLFFVFPRSGFDVLNAATLEGLVKERAFTLSNKLRGIA